MAAPPPVRELRPSEKDRVGPDLFPTLPPAAMRCIARFLPIWDAMPLQRLSPWWRRNLVPWLQRDAAWWLTAMLPHYAARSNPSRRWRSQYVANIPDSLLLNFTAPPVAPSVQWLVLGNEDDPDAAGHEIALVRPVLPYLETLHVEYCSMADIADVFAVARRIRHVHIRNVKTGVPRTAFPFFVPPLLESLRVDGVLHPVSSEFASTRAARIASEAEELVINAGHLNTIVARLCELSTPMLSRIIRANPRLHTLLLVDQLEYTRGFVDVDFSACTGVERLCLCGAYASKRNLASARQNCVGITDFLVQDDSILQLDRADAREYAPLSATTDDVAALVKTQHKLRSLCVVLWTVRSYLIDDVAATCPDLRVLMLSDRLDLDLKPADDRVLALAAACPHLTHLGIETVMLQTEETYEKIKRTHKLSYARFMLHDEDSFIYYRDRGVANVTFVTKGIYVPIGEITRMTFDLRPDQFNRIFAPHRPDY